MSVQSNGYKQIRNSSFLTYEQFPVLQNCSQKSPATDASVGGKGLMRVKGSGYIHFFTYLRQVVKNSWRDSFL